MGVNAFLCSSPHSVLTTRVGNSGGSCNGSCINREFSSAISGIHSLQLPVLIFCSKQIPKSLRGGAIIRGLKINIQWIKKKCSLEKEIRKNYLGHWTRILYIESQVYEDRIELHAKMGREEAVCILWCEVKECSHDLSESIFRSTCSEYTVDNSIKGGYSSARIQSVRNRNSQRDSVLLTITEKNKEIE